ncbi:hypothetical protein IV102_32345 [bacterium]|nr:hypothetical protein [bacterium]
MKNRSRLIDLLLIVVVIALGCAGWWWRQSPVNPLVGRWRVLSKSSGGVTVVFAPDGHLEVWEKGKREQEEARYRVDLTTSPGQLDVSIHRNGRTETYRMICEFTPTGQLRVQEGHPKETRPVAFTQDAEVMERVRESPP